MQTRQTGRQTSVIGHQIGADSRYILGMACKQRTSHHYAYPTVERGFSNCANALGQAIELLHGSKGKTHHVKLVALDQRDRVVEQVVGAAGHVPAAALKELGHHGQAKGVLLARRGHEQDAQAVADRVFVFFKIGAELVQHFLQSAQADGDIGEVAQVVFPQFTQVARGGRQQIQA